MTTSDQRKKQEFISSVTGWRFKLFLITRLPMGFLAGLRIVSLSEDKCITSVPFKALNKNPFRSIYFAVLSMAAELSTAATCLMAVRLQETSIAYIIVKHQGVFHKKSTGRVFFTCEDAGKAFEAVQKSAESGESETATFKTTGRLKDGTIVAEYEFTWSFKRRS